VSDPRHFREGDRAVRQATDVQAPTVELDVGLRGLEEMRGDLPRPVLHALGRQQDRGATHAGAAAAAGAEADGDDPGVAVKHGHVVGGDAERVGDDLGEGGLAALAVGRGPGEHGDAARGLHAHRAVLVAGHGHHA
jgi:hypothetical protein